MRESLYIKNEERREVGEGGELTPEESSLPFRTGAALLSLILWEVSKSWPQQNFPNFATNNNQTLDFLREKTLARRCSRWRFAKGRDTSGVKETLAVDLVLGMSAPRPLSSLGDLYSWLSRGRSGPVTPSGSPSTSTSRPGRQQPLDTPLCEKSDVLSHAVPVFSPSPRKKKKRKKNRMFSVCLSFFSSNEGRDRPIDDFIDALSCDRMI